MTRKEAAYSFDPTLDDIIGVLEIATKTKLVTFLLTEVASNIPECLGKVISME